jgi:TonB family protein
MRQLVRLFLITAVLLSGFVAASVRAQDLTSITGVTAPRFVPPARRRRPRQNPPSPRPNPRPTPRPRPNDRTTPPPVVDTDAEVDRAIVAGNTAREARNFSEAERQYRRAAALDASEARAYAGLGGIFYEQGRYTESQAALLRAAQLDPEDFGSRVNLAFAYNMLEQPAQADRWARDAIRIAPNEFSAYAALGWSLYRQQNFTEAERNYRRALELSPNTPGLHHDLGLVLLGANRTREAVETFRRALTINPRDTSSLHNLGLSFQRLGQLNEAAAQYERAFQVDPRLAVSHANLGLVRYVQSDFDAARREWQLAVQLGTTYPIARIGLTLLDGNLTEAHRQLSDYTADNASDEDGWLLLGDVRQTLGNETGAQEAYRRAREIAPDYAALPRPNLRRIIGTSSNERQNPVSQQNSNQPTTSAGRIINVGSLNGRTISRPEPVYSPVARAGRVQGAVVVRVTVDESGQVIAAEAVSGHPVLRPNAVAAARNARFAPMQMNGRAVRFTGTLVYNFRL